MLKRPRLVTGWSLVFCCACGAQVPTVGPARLVAQGSATSNILNLESVIIASPLSPNDVLIAWRHIVQPVPNLDSFTFSIQYRVSLDWNAAFQPISTLPFPPSTTCDTTAGTTDPTVAASRADGALYLAAYTRTGGAWFLVGRKPLGATAIYPSTTAQAGECAGELDREWLAIGPQATGGEAGYIAPDTDGGGMFLRNVGSSSSTGFTWPTASTDPGFTHSVDFLGGGQAAGKGFYPVVLQSGRVVMGYGRWDTSGYFAPTGFTYSDDSGVTWNAEGLADAYGPAGTSHNIESIRYQGAVPVPGGVQVWSCPSLSWDPTDSSRAWMISAGRTDDPQASPTDIDLFISRSQITNGVLSFPPDSRYRVTDAQLLIAGEPNVESDEFMPSIGVDQRGGINIAFVRTTTPDGTPTADTRVTVRYARWLSAADLAAGHTPFVQDLSTPFVPRPGNSGNDYIMLTTSGCYVYIAYAADPDGDWNIYAHRVLIPCIISDVTADGVVNSDDVVAFGLAYPPALPQADVNHDGAVNAQDVVDFLNDYACGGCPH